MSNEIRDRIVVSTIAKLIAEIIWWIVVWIGSNAVAEQLTSNFAAYIPWVVTGLSVIIFSYFGRRSPHIRAFLMSIYEYLVFQGLRRVLGLIVLGGSAYIGYLVIADARIFIVAIGLVLASLLLQNSIRVSQPGIFGTYKSYLKNISDQDLEHLPRFWPLSEYETEFFDFAGGGTMEYQLEGNYTFNGVVFDLWRSHLIPSAYDGSEVSFHLPEEKRPEPSYYAVQHVKKVHLLMNAFGREYINRKVKQSVRNRKIGEIGLIFEGDTQYTYDLILGDNIRFYVVNRKDTETTVVSTSNPSTMVAWQGKDDDDELVLDHIQVEVPSNLRSKKLMGIRFQQQLIQYFVFAATIEFDKE